MDASVPTNVTRLSIHTPPTSAPDHLASEEPLEIRVRSTLR